MVGTRRAFYLVPVTRPLSVAVVTGEYPEAPTEVVKALLFRAKPTIQRRHGDT